MYDCLIIITNILLYLFLMYVCMYVCMYECKYVYRYVYRVGRMYGILGRFTFKDTL